MPGSRASRTRFKRALRLVGYRKATVRLLSSLTTVGASPHHRTHDAHHHHHHHTTIGAPKARPPRNGPALRWAQPARGRVSPSTAPQAPRSVTKDVKTRVPCRPPCPLVDPSRKVCIDRLARYDICKLSAATGASARPAPHPGRQTHRPRREHPGATPPRTGERPWHPSEAGRHGRHAPSVTRKRPGARPPCL